MTGYGLQAAGRMIGPRGLENLPYCGPAGGIEPKLVSGIEPRFGGVFIGIGVGLRFGNIPPLGGPEESPVPDGVVM